MSLVKMPSANNNMRLIKTSKKVDSEQATPLSRATINDPSISPVDGRCMFLEVPPEVRDVVYQVVVASQPVVEIANNLYDHSAVEMDACSAIRLVGKRRFEYTATALSEVSRTVRAEFWQLWLSITTFSYVWKYKGYDASNSFPVDATFSEVRRLAMHPGDVPNKPIGKLNPNCNLIVEAPVHESCLLLPNAERSADWLTRHLQSEIAKVDLFAGLVEGWLRILEGDSVSLHTTRVRDLTGDGTGHDSGER
jgi:hypothetical protein